MPRPPMSDPTPSESLPPAADAYQISKVALTDVRVFKRLRPLEPARVESLAASMGSKGLRYPIVVRRTAERLPPHTWSAPTGSRTPIEVADYPRLYLLRYDCRSGCTRRSRRQLDFSARRAPHTCLDSGISF